MLESSTGAYIKWIVNELMMTANKIEYKDVSLVMFSADAITREPDSHEYHLESFIFFYRVSLFEYN